MGYEVTFSNPKFVIRINFTGIRVDGDKATGGKVAGVKVAKEAGDLEREMTRSVPRTAETVMITTAVTTLEMVPAVADQREM